MTLLGKPLSYTKERGRYKVRTTKGTMWTWQLATGGEPEGAVLASVEEWANDVQPTLVDNRHLRVCHDEGCPGQDDLPKCTCEIVYVEVWGDTGYRSGKRYPMMAVPKSRKANH